MSTRINQHDGMSSSWILKDGKLEPDIHQIQERCHEAHRVEQIVRCVREGGGVGLFVGAGGLDENGIEEVLRLCPRGDLDG